MSLGLLWRTKTVDEANAAAALSGSDRVPIAQGISSTIVRTTLTAIATKVGTLIGLGTMATQNANAVNISGGAAALTTGTISSAPAGGNDIVNKSYVDALALGVAKRGNARVATTANITIATALNNGDSLDGVTLATGDLVLVKDQSAPAENGVYVVGVSPARAPQYDTYNEIAGALIVVEEGSTNADKAWLCTSNEGGTLNSTAITFARIYVEVPTSYVDSQDVVVANRTKVRVATTANITIATALNNGDSLDGVTLATGDLVLVKDQSAPAENGVYVVGVSPARAPQYDTFDKIAGSVIFVNTATLNANPNTMWVCASGMGGTLNSTAIVFNRMVTRLDSVKFLMIVVSGINFNSGNTDNSFPLALFKPPGFNRWQLQSVIISGASGDLTTATCGVFTQTGAGGDALVASGSAITVSTATENTANNLQSLAIQNNSDRTHNADLLYFRVQTPQGAARTATVSMGFSFVS